MDTLCYFGPLCIAKDDVCSHDSCSAAWIDGEQEYHYTTVPYMLAPNVDWCPLFKDLDVKYNTLQTSPLHHDNRCPTHK